MFGKVLQQIYLSPKSEPFFTTSMLLLKLSFGDEEGSKSQAAEGFLFSCLWAWGILEPEEQHRLISVLTIKL